MRRALTALIVVLMLIPTLPVSAMSYNLSGGALTVDTEHYKAVFNSSGLLTSLYLKDPGIELIGCSSYAPSNRIEAGGRDYSEAAWTYRLVYNNSRLLVVEARPVNETGLTLLITFYNDKPFFDVEYIPDEWNTSITVQYTALYGDPSNWTWIYGSPEIGGVVGFASGRIESPLWVMGYTGANDTFLFMGVKPLAWRPGLEAEASTSLGDNPSLVLSFKSLNGSLGLRVFYGKYNARWLEEAGFNWAAWFINSTAYSDYEKAAKDPSELLSRLEKLEERVVNLTKENIELRQNATSLEGELNACRGNLTIWINDIRKNLVEENKALALQRYEFLITGIVLGAIAAAAAYRLGALEEVDRIVKRILGG